MAHTTRTYMVTNPSTLFGPGARITFTSNAPVGSVIQLTIKGRAVRVLLTGVPLNGRLLGAELQNIYL
jgi:hypothetical protein